MYVIINFFSLFNVAFCTTLSSNFGSDSGSNSGSDSGSDCGPYSESDPGKPSSLNLIGFNFASSGNLAG